MGGKRSARAEEFIGNPSWGASALSADLVVSARSMLEQALHDRRRDVYRLASTHYTPRAVGALALVVAAFEAFLNQAYVFSLYELPWHEGGFALGALRVLGRGLLDGHVGGRSSARAGHHGKYLMIALALSHLPRQLERGYGVRRDAEEALQAHGDGEQ